MTFILKKIHILCATFMLVLLIGTPVGAKTYKVDKNGKNSDITASIKTSKWLNKNPTVTITLNTYKIKCKQLFNEKKTTTVTWTYDAYKVTVKQDGVELKPTDVKTKKKKSKQLKYTLKEDAEVTINIKLEDPILNPGTTLLHGVSNNAGPAISYVSNPSYSISFPFLSSHEVWENVPAVAGMKNDYAAKRVITSESISLDCTEKYMTKGQSFKLTAKTSSKSKVKYTVSPKGVVKVSANGTVKALKKGTAIVKATCGGVSANCRVHVSNPSKTTNTTNKAYVSLYKSFLSKSQVPNAAGNSYFKPSAFAILNIDGVDVPELLVASYYGNSDGRIGFTAYTIKNGKVVTVGDYAGRTETGNAVVYNKKYHFIKFYGWVNGVGGVYEKGVGMDSTKKMADLYFCSEYSNYGATAKNKWKGRQAYFTSIGSTTAKEVTKSEYTSFYKKYFNSADMKNVYFLANTATNRNSIS